MSIISKLNCEICEALGLDTSTVRNVDIVLRPNALPVIEVEHVLFDEKKVEALRAVLRKYVLVEKDDGK